MTLQQFIDVLRRRRWWVAAITLLGIAVGVGLSLVTTPLYRSSASVFVSVSGGASVSDLSQGGNFSEARVASYAQLVSAPRVLQDAARRAGLDRTLPELEGSVTVSTSAETVILTISVTDPSPKDAAALADAVADELVDVVGDIERADDTGSALVKLSVYQRAEAPTTPVSPRIAVNVALGLLLGLGAGIAAALLRDVVDTKIRSVDGLRRLTESSVLAEIPLEDDPDSTRLVDTTTGYSGRAEAFRQLRTHLTFTNLDGGPQSIVVTSASPGEGKSSTAVNLALMLAQNDHRVLLIDADLRRPAASGYLGIEQSVGLSTVLTHQVELEDAVQVVGQGGLHVLAAGLVPPNPSELLGSRQMGMLLEIVREQYDYVVIDAPPLLPVTDPAVIAALSSGVLFVTSVDGRLANAELLRALATVEAVGARVLGIVANRVKGVRQTDYYGYAPSGEPTASPRRASRRAREESAR